MRCHCNFATQAPSPNHCFMLLLCATYSLPPTPYNSCLCVKVLTAQTSHTRHLSEAAQLRQELRQLSGRLQLAESDQQHLEAACKQTTATAEAEWATKVHGCIACFTFFLLSDYGVARMWAQCAADAAHAAASCSLVHVLVTSDTRCSWLVSEARHVCWCVLRPLATD